MIEWTDHFGGWMIANVRQFEVLPAVAQYDPGSLPHGTAVQIVDLRSIEDAATSHSFR